MDPEERQRSDALAAAVELASKSRFYSLVALIERLTPDAQRIGGGGPPSKEAIRFRHDPSLSFSAGDVAQAMLLEVPSIADDPLSPKRTLVEIVTTFLGLTGIATPLPLYMAEGVAHEDEQNPIQRDFLDVFHHRLISLLYRLVRRYEFASEFRRDLHNRWALRSQAVVGLDAYERKPSELIPAWRLLRLLPLVVGRARSARSLQLAIEDLLADDIPDLVVDIRQFVGGWVPVEPDERCSIGVHNHRLGVDTLIGSRVFDRTGAFAVRLSPISADVYPRLLRDGDLFALVREAVRLFTRDSVDYDLELVLHADAVPALKLSKESGAVLGRDSWLRGRRAEKTLVLKDAMSKAAA